MRRFTQAVVFVAAAGWIAGCSVAKSSQTDAAGRQMERGRILISSYGCVACHEVPGVPAATGSVGPSLKGIARRMYLAGRLTNTPDNLMRWIRHPHAVDPQTVMPEMNVTEQDARDLSQFLYTLR